MESDVAIWKVSLGETVRKNALFLSVRVNVFHSVVWKVDFFGAIGIVLLTLLTKNRYRMYVPCKIVFFRIFKQTQIQVNPGPLLLVLTWETQ